MTTSDGLNRFTTLASIRPTRRPADWSSATDTGSPNEAARATSSAVTPTVLIQRCAELLASTLDAPLPPLRGRCPAASKGLETADVAAAADDGRVVNDLDVADVAGTALRAAMDPPVRDDPGADAGPTFMTMTLSCPTATPERHSPRARRLTSLSTHTGARIAAGEAFAHRIAVPAGHDRRRDRPPAANSTGPGTPMPMPHRRPGRSRVPSCSSANSSSTRWRQRLRAVGDVGRLVTVGEDPAIEVGDRDIDARRAKVGDEDVPGVRAKRQLARRAAARARPDPVVDDQAELDQLADALGDDASAQTRASNKLGARTRPSQPYLVENRDQCVERLARRPSDSFSRLKAARS